MLPTLIVIGVVLLVLVSANLVLLLRRPAGEAGSSGDEHVEQTMLEGFKEARDTRRDEFERARDVQTKSAAQLREEVVWRTPFCVEPGVEKLQSVVRRHRGNSRPGGAIDTRGPVFEPAGSRARAFSWFGCVGPA